MRARNCNSKLFLGDLGPRLRTSNMEHTVCQLLGGVILEGFLPLTSWQPLEAWGSDAHGDMLSLGGWGCPNTVVMMMVASWSPRNVDRHVDNWRGMGCKVLDADIVADVVIAHLSFHLHMKVVGGDCCAPGLVLGTGRATDMILTGFLPSKSSV